MHQGQLLIGAGEVGRDGLGAVSSDDLARNRASGVIPRFFTRHEKKLDGTYHEVEYLELLIPGDAKSSPCHLVDDRLRDRYAPHYKAFKENREAPSEGTPVEAWLGASNEGLILMLKSLHLKTVENVAEMSDQTISTIGMGGRELRTRAQKFLEVQKKASTADELAAKDDVIASAPGPPGKALEVQVRQATRRKRTRSPIVSRSKSSLR
jgi:hypothetical protein